MTAVSLFFAQQRIAALETIDPDDALRMVQVRDLVAGQAWWDVMQHRVNPVGGGGLMHWSRIVDLPMATGIAILSPLVGQALAERIIFATMPFVLLLVLFWAVMRIAQRLGDVRIAYVAPAML
ncbi:MAG: hypothetical protein MUF41_06035, partial [Sphingopyxis sp.]|nr:hypothetical protein [Sphingopyxis sp.]